MQKKLLDNNILAVRSEQAILDKLPVDQKTLRMIGRILEPKNLKRIGIAAVGGSVLISFISTYGRDRINRAATAQEIKKQLVPLQKRLDDLEAQNRELKAQLDKIYAEMQHNGN